MCEKKNGKNFRIQKANIIYIEDKSIFKTDFQDCNPYISKTKSLENSKVCKAKSFRIIGLKNL